MNDEKEWFSGAWIDVDKQPLEERRAPYGLAALAVMVVLVLAFLLGCANAAPRPVEVPVHVHESNGLKAQLLAKPCDDPRVMVMLLANMPTVAERFKRVEADFKLRSGEWKHFTGCWAELTEAEVGVTSIALLFSDGDYYLVPKAEFLKGKGTGV